MDKNIVKAQDVFLDRINLICGKFGLNNIMAQLYAILYFYGKPLSLNDMVERLKISKGSVSVNIRALERYGVVRKVWIKGSRRDYYEAESDIAKVILERVKSMAKSRLNEVKDMLTASEDSLQAVNSDTTASEDTVLFAQKIGRLKELYSKAQGVIDLLDSGFLQDNLPGREENKAGGITNATK